MSDCLQDVSLAIAEIDRRIRATKARHVNAASIRELICSSARTYFEDMRPQLAEQFAGQEDLLDSLDAIFQDLVRFAQARTRVGEYRTSLRSGKSVIGQLELSRLRFRPKAESGLLSDSRQQKVIESLKRINRTAGEAYEQGLLDLKMDARISWRGTAVEFREALRETLDGLAPDSEVTTKQAGFKLEPDAKGPTMKQKAVFIFRARRLKDGQMRPLNDAINVIEELIGKFIRSVYTRSSVAVHVASSKAESQKIRDYVTLVLAELLEIKD